MGKGAACESCGHEHTNWIPSSRLSQVVQARDEARGRAESAEQRLATAKTEAGAKVSTAEQKMTEMEALLGASREEITRLVASHQEASTMWGQEKAAYGAGISDAEGVDFARIAYQRVPESNRPEGGITEWLTNRDALPKAVQAYLPPTNGAVLNRGETGTVPNADRPTAMASGSITAAARDGSLKTNREAIYAGLGMPVPSMFRKTE